MHVSLTESLFHKNYSRPWFHPWCAFACQLSCAPWDCYT